MAYEAEVRRLGEGPVDDPALRFESPRAAVS
jgi:hypothetical protein